VALDVVVLFAAGDETVVVVVAFALVLLAVVGTMLEVDVLVVDDFACRCQPPSSTRLLPLGRKMS
jgi:hypothetical protein